VLLRSFSFLLVFLFLSSCGYHFGQGTLSEQYSSINVPYVEGDQEGELTAELIKQFKCSGAFNQSFNGGALLLKVKILDFREKNIGFRYDQTNDDEYIKSIIPAETRLIAIAEITLIDECSGECILGPLRISTSVDYDHEYYSSRNGVNIFSLGQLTDSDEAKDAAYHPLNVALAQKIVDYIINSW
jgi:outer membrane lipopolysaccharide assembly protein LptE/RlpB